MSDSRSVRQSLGLELQNDLYSLYLLKVKEMEYPSFFTRKRICNFMMSLPETTSYNVLVCLFILVIIVLVSNQEYNIECSDIWEFIIAFMVLDVLYIAHVLLVLLHDYHRRQTGETITFLQVGYAIDAIVCCNQLWNYVICPISISKTLWHSINLTLYGLRLHRANGYLWHLNDYYLKGSIVGTLFKYLYYAFTMRVLFATILIFIEQVTFTQYPVNIYWHALYATNKLFIAIGPDAYPINDLARLWYMTVMLSGCLVVMGIAVASLSLIIGLYLRPEETFRNRFQLIMKDMVVTNIPKPLLEKVETFYRMFWTKQKAVAKTQLLPTYPPCLESDVYSNIYFRAQLKSPIMYNLSNYFLAEVAKYMETIHYIPGEHIIKRNTNKSSLVYISYGDVEILSAEDDETPLLRLSRGSIKNPCGICPELACTRAHVAVRAATFCTAHVLKLTDFWRVCAKYGKRNLHNQIIHAALKEHLDQVKAHHYDSMHYNEFKHKSNIIQLKRSLIDLKEARDEDGNLYLDCSNYVLNLADCYIMRNLSFQANTAMRMESDPICLKNTFPCILQPKSSLVVVWNSFIAIITLIVAIVHPYNLVFLKTLSNEFIFFNFVVSIIYIVDIVVHVSTGTKVEEGVSLTLTETAAYRMHSRWFPIHFISVLPIFEFVDDGRFAGVNKLCKVPVIFRMLKALEDDSVYHSNIIRFFSYFLLVTLLAYFMATLNQGFLCFTFDYCLVKNLTDEPYWSQGTLDDETIDNRITFSIYWAISMITFTSHKTAALTRQHSNTKTIWFKLFVLCVLEACLIIRLLIESCYSATIMVSETIRERYQMSIKSVMRFFEKNNVDPVLRNRFIKYLRLCWLTDKAYGITNSNKSILFDLPKHVHQDILTLQRSKYLLSVQFTKYLPNELLKNIASQARIFYVSPNEILLQTGDMTNEIYIIKQGVCEILDPETQKRKGLLEPKASFGDLECLLRIPAYYTIRAVTHVRIYTISRKYLTPAIALPKIKDAINYVKQLPEYEALTIRREPFVSYEDPPPAPNRQCFPLPRKFQSDHGFLNPFQRLGFFSVLRYVFPRFTIRPDGLYLKRYEWFRASCAVSAALIFPLYTYFVMQWPWLSYFAFMLDIAAYVDMIQRMLVGYFDANGILVYHPAATAAHYLKGAFLVDFFSCMPLEHLDYVRTTIYLKDKAYKQPWTIQFFMYNRIVQFYRVPGALKILDEYIERKDIILMIKAFPLIISLLAVVTSQMLDRSVERWAPIGGGWRFEIINPKDSWIIRNSNIVRYNITETPFLLVLTTFYWAVYETTNTGLNVFQAGTTSLMTVISTGMLLGLMIITYYSVRVISIRSNVNQALASFQENMRDMVVFMKKENLDPRLRREVEAYYKYMWKTTGGTTNRSVLKLCDQVTLRTDALLQIYGSTFDKSPILYKCDLSLLRAMGRALNTECYPQGMTIIERGDVVGNMYIVDYGTVEVRDPESNNEILAKLRSGSVFGNLEKVSSVLSTYKFAARANTQLLKISTELFYDILQDYPSSKALLIKFCCHNQDYIESSFRFTSVIFDDSPKGKIEKIIRIIMKDRKCLQIYFILVSLLCVYGDIYNASFERNGFNLICSLYVLDGLFLLKIVRQIVLLYFAVKKPLASRDAGYFKTEFRCDLLSILPIEIFSFLADRPMELFPVLRLNRVLRVTTAYNCLKNYNEKYIDLTMTTITSVFIWFSFFVHCSACFWNWISTIEEKYYPGILSWKYKDDGSSLCGHEYLCSLYFILTTFTQNGVGDILPRQPGEVAFVCVLMILSTIIFMIYVGEFSSIIQFRLFRYYTFYAKYLELLEFLKNNRVSENLANRVKKYSCHLFRESRGNQFPYFLETAPQCLRLHIMSVAYMHHLTSHEIFMKCEPRFLRQLVGLFQLFIYCEDMHVVKADQITNAMYFVHKGCVVEEDEDFDEKLSFIKSGQYFGTVHGLTRDLPYDTTYKTVTKSQVLTLTFDKWEYLLKHFPNSKNILYGPDSDRTPSFATAATYGSSANISSATRDVLQPKSAATLYSQMTSDGKVTDIRFKSSTSFRFQATALKINDQDEVPNVSEHPPAVTPNDKPPQPLVAERQDSTVITKEIEHEQSKLSVLDKVDRKQTTASDTGKKYDTLAQEPSNDMPIDNEKKVVLLDIIDNNEKDGTSDKEPALVLKLKPSSIEENANNQPSSDKKQDEQIPLPLSDTTLKPESNNRFSFGEIKYSNEGKQVSDHEVTISPVELKEPRTSLSPLESKNLPPVESMKIIELSSSFTNDENDNNLHELDFKSKETKKGDEHTATLVISNAQDESIELNTLQTDKKESEQTSKSEDLPHSKSKEISGVPLLFSNNENDNIAHYLDPSQTEGKKEDRETAIDKPIELNAFQTGNNESDQTSETSSPSSSGPSGTKDKKEKSENGTSTKKSDP